MSSHNGKLADAHQGTTRAARRREREQAARAQARKLARRKTAMFGMAGFSAAALVIALVVMLIANKAKPGAHLSPQAFASYSTSATLIDVRTPSEYASGHLAGARNLDVEAADFTSRISALDHNANYALYCHSGNRSATALQLMHDAGFTHVKDLAGGITAWTNAGRPTTTS